MPVMVKSDCRSAGNICRNTVHTYTIVDIKEENRFLVLFRHDEDDSECLGERAMGVFKLVTSYWPSALASRVRECMQTRRRLHPR